MHVVGVEGDAYHQGGRYLTLTIKYDGLYADMEASCWSLPVWHTTAHGVEGQVSSSANKWHNWVLGVGLMI